MSARIRFFRFILIISSLLSLPLLVMAVEHNQSSDNQSLLAHKLSNTLVVVEKIMGSDDQGNSHTIYHYENGRQYRLDDIEQVMLDLDAQKIKLEGTFRSVHVVLGSTVYLMGVSELPQPTLRIATVIPERLPLAVDNLKIANDHIIVVYSTDCTETPI